jgi:Xaa-Pro aminopeptidase
MSVCSIDAAAQKIIEEADYAQYSQSRTGHGMGILGHEYPEDMAFNYPRLIDGPAFF